MRLNATVHYIDTGKGKLTWGKHPKSIIIGVCFVVLPLLFSYFDLTIKYFATYLHVINWPSWYEKCKKNNIPKKQIIQFFIPTDNTFWPKLFYDFILEAYPTQSYAQHKYKQHIHLLYLIFWEHFRIELNERTIQSSKVVKWPCDKTTRESTKKSLNLDFFWMWWITAHVTSSIFHEYQH